jgi:hypothetical protein
MGGQPTSHRRAHTAPALSVDLFDGNYRVRERGPYIKAAVEAIHAQGVCAVEQVEEIAVKTSNGLS